jgi:hypothetical protein
MDLLQHRAPPKLGQIRKHVRLFKKFYIATQAVRSNEGSSFQVISVT